MRRRAIRSTLAVVACALTVGACDEHNRFTGPVGEREEGPTILAVLVPETVRPNEVLDIQIQAVAVEGIATVDVRLVESVVRDRTLTFDPPETELDTFTEFQLPPTLTQETILVRVQVADRLGTRSEPVEAEILVVQDTESF